MASVVIRDARSQISQLRQVEVFPQCISDQRGQGRCVKIVLWVMLMPRSTNVSLESSLVPPLDLSNINEGLLGENVGAGTG